MSMKLGPVSNYCCSSEAVFKPHTIRGSKTSLSGDDTLKFKRGLDSDSNVEGVPRVRVSTADPKAIEATIIDLRAGERVRTHLSCGSNYSHPMKEHLIKEGIHLHVLTDEARLCIKTDHVFFETIDVKMKGRSAPEVQASVSTEFIKSGTSNLVDLKPTTSKFCYELQMGLTRSNNSELTRRASTSVVPNSTKREVGKKASRSVSFASGS